MRFQKLLLPGVLTLGLACLILPLSDTYCLCAAEVAAPQETAQTMLESGIKAEQQGDLDAAELAYTKSLQIAQNTENAQEKSWAGPILHRLAVLKAKKGRAADSERLFREALELDGPGTSRQNVALYCDFAKLFLDQKKYPEAETVLKKAVLAAPDHRRALFNLGLAIALQNERQMEGLRYLKLALGEASAYRELAKIYRATGQGVATESQAQFAEERAAALEQSQARSSQESLNSPTVTMDEAAKKELQDQIRKELDRQATPAAETAAQTETTISPPAVPAGTPEDKPARLPIPELILEESVQKSVEPTAVEQKTAATESVEKASVENKPAEKEPTEQKESKPESAAPQTTPPQTTLQTLPPTQTLVLTEEFSAQSGVRTLPDADTPHRIANATADGNENGHDSGEGVSPLPILVLPLDNAPIHGKLPEYSAIGIRRIPTPEDSTVLSPETLSPESSASDGTAGGTTVSKSTPATGQPSLIHLAPNNIESRSDMEKLARLQSITPSFSEGPLPSLTQPTVLISLDSPNNRATQRFAPTTPIRARGPEQRRPASVPTVETFVEKPRSEWSFHPPIDETVNRISRIEIATSKTSATSVRRTETADPAPETTVLPEQERQERSEWQFSSTVAPNVMKFAVADGVVDDIISADEPESAAIPEPVMTTSLIARTKVLPPTILKFEPAVKPVRQPKPQQEYMLGTKEDYVAKTNEDTSAVAASKTPPPEKPSPRIPELIEEPQKPASETAHKSDTRAEMTNEDKPAVTSTEVAQTTVEAPAAPADPFLAKNTPSPKTVIRFEPVAQSPAPTESLSVVQKSQPLPPAATFANPSESIKNDASVETKITDAEMVETENTATKTPDAPPLEVAKTVPRGFAPLNPVRDPVKANPLLFRKPDLASPSEEGAGAELAGNVSTPLPASPSASQPTPPLLPTFPELAEAKTGASTETKTEENKTLQELSRQFAVQHAEPIKTTPPIPESIAAGRPAPRTEAAAPVQPPAKVAAPLRGLTAEPEQPEEESAGFATTRPKTTPPNPQHQRRGRQQTAQRIVDEMLSPQASLTDHSIFSDENEPEPDSDAGFARSGSYSK